MAALEHARPTAQEFQYFSNRSDARDNGQSHYFTGIPCKHGHVAIRRTLDCVCSECKKSLDAGHYAKNREKIKSQVKLYIASNKVACQERSASYYQRNKESIRQYIDGWRSINAEHVRLKGRQYAAKRKANFLGADGKYSTDDVARILKLQKSKCAYCQSNLDDFEIDHIAPLSKGGSNWPKNLQLLCRPCNRSKHALDPITYAQKIGRLV